MKVISVTSGKGGVGKTSIVSNLAVRLAQLGRRVLILDGDLGMANVDIAFNVKTEFNVHHVLIGEKSFNDIIVEVAKNIHLLPGGSGLQEINNINFFHRQALVDAVAHMSMNYDYLLIDTAPGIGDNVLYLNHSADSVNVVVTPDPTSVTDAYALIKTLNKVYKMNKFEIICNQVRDEDDGLRLFQKFQDVVIRFLNVAVSYQGSLPSDQELRLANRQQRLIMRQESVSPFAVALKNLATNVDKNNKQFRSHARMQDFWNQLSAVGRA